MSSERPRPAPPRSLRVLDLPRRLNLRITDRCGHACLMCGQARRRALEGVGREEFSRAQLDRYLRDHAPSLGGEAYFWGGEPLLREDLPDLVALLRKRGFRTVVNTSGAQLREEAPALGAVQEWVISVDGTAVGHDRVRRDSGLFARVMTGVEQLRRQGNAKLVANFTITEENQAELAAAVRALDRAGFTEICLQLPTFATGVSGALFDAAVAKHFAGPTRRTWRHFERPYKTIDAELLAAEIDRAYTMLGARLRMIPYRIRSAAALRRYFADPLAVVSRKRGRCLALGEEITVEPDGSLVSCPDFPDIVLGHIDDAPWPYPWQSKRIQRAREAYVQDGLGVCARCCRYF